jgi:hypothetical protein
MLGHGTLRFRDRITHKSTKNLQQEIFCGAASPRHKKFGSWLERLSFAG